MRSLLAAAALLCLAALPARAQNACAAYPYTLVNGTTADASQVMANFNSVLNCVNAILDDTVAQNVLLSSNGSAPLWSPYTMPASIVNKGILAGTATNVIGQLASCNNGVYITGSVGAASCGTTFTVAQIANIFNPAAPSTGNTMSMSLTNSGTQSNAATAAQIFSSLSGANVFTAMQVFGGANPTGVFSCGSAVTGGCSLTAGAGLLALTGNTGITMAGITNAAGNEIICWNSGNNLLTWEPNVAGCVPSSLRFKYVQGPLSDSWALDSVTRSLRPVAYTYKEPQRYGDRLYVGLIAEDVCAMDPRLCVYEDGRVANYDHVGVVAYLVGAVQELAAKVERLERQP